MPFKAIPLWIYIFFFSTSQSKIDFFFSFFFFFFPKSLLPFVGMTEAPETSPLLSRGLLWAVYHLQGRTSDFLLPLLYIRFSLLPRAQWNSTFSLVPTLTFSTNSAVRHRCHFGNRNENNHRFKKGENRAVKIVFLPAPLPFVGDEDGSHRDCVCPS